MEMNTLTRDVVRSRILGLDGFASSCVIAPSNFIDGAVYAVLPIRARVAR